MSARILLVEDNATNRYLATYLLEQHGYSVTHAVDGEEALATAVREKPDVILMDIQMPKMDGYEATRLLKQREELRDVPVIALTSYAMAGDRERALTSGFAGYIEKPIATETFAAEVQRHLKP